MKTKRRLCLSVVALSVALFGTMGSGCTNGASSAGGTLAIDDDDIGGVVTGENGPEAGVWVIAETADLPTTFAKIVVTDDLGRYMLPDLPRAGYSLWVRGYGLADSPVR